MTPAETAKLLAKASAFDQRTVGTADVAAWHEVLADVDFTDALVAVSRHYAEHVERLMPAHVRAHVKTIRAQRRAVEHHEVLALPGRFDPDPGRDARIARGLSRCSAILAPLLAELASRRADVDPVDDIRGRALARARRERSYRRDGQ